MPPSTLTVSHPSVDKSPGDWERSEEKLSRGNCAHRDERFETASAETPPPIAPPTSGPKPRGNNRNLVVGDTAIEGETADKNAENGATSEIQCNFGDTLALHNGTPPLVAATVARKPPCMVAAETSLFSAAQAPNTAQATSTALLSLSGSFSDGVVPCFTLGQHETACTTEIRPAMSMPSACHGTTAAAETVKNLMVLGNHKGGNLLCTKELEWPTAVKQSQASGHRSRTTYRVKRMTAGRSFKKSSATASAPGPSSPSFTKNDHAVPDTGAELEPAKIELELPFETKQGMGRMIGETLVGGKADREQPRSLRRDISSDQVIPVPVPPPYKPSLWEDPQHALMGIRPYRSRVLVTAATVASVRAREEQQRGPNQPLLFSDSRAGTVAAVTAKDVHHVMPRASVPRPTMKIFHAEDLMTFVSQPPRYPSPPVSRNRGRAFGVISPLSWSADSCDHRVTTAPRPAGSDDSSREAAASQRGGSSPWGCRHIATSSQNGSVPNNSFFPVRPRASRRVPGPFRSRAQTVPQP